MKTIFYTVLFSLVFILDTYAQNTKGVYLSEALSPVEYHAYKPVKDFIFDIMHLGDVEYKHGFGLWTTYGPTRPGYAEFSLKGKYKTLTFIVGCYTAENQGTNKAVMAIRGDGRKLLERVVTDYDVPQRISLDVSGVDKLRFEIVMNDVNIGIAEPLLWTEAQTPIQTGKLSRVTGNPMMLVRDLRPYKLNNFHTCISQDENYSKDLREIKINGKTYTSGLLFNADMQLIGQDERRTFFNLEGKYSTLEFIAGPQDSDAGTLGVAWITVKGDDKILFEEEVGEGCLAKTFAVDISGCRWISIESQQSKGSSHLAVVNATVYPEGYDMDDNTPSGEMLETSAEVKALPDVCKLVSNIPPYAVGGGISRENMVYDGQSDYRTFSMGGIKYNEGLILQSMTNVLNDNTRSHALFNLEGEFDYISFTTGWISKCGVLKNDTLRVYADSEIVYQTPLVATSENRHHVVPLNKCRKLTFEKRGIVSFNHSAFGVADIVLYRGEPVENELFVHPKPDCPDEIDLIDLSKPYIHYVSPLKDHQTELLKDGTSKKNYFTMPDGTRIYKCFLLKTSVHFDLEMGPTGSPAVGATAGMMGSAIMVGAVGGATITAISPFGALIALASGGTAHESSCAAFNTWGEYDNITFTVGCHKKASNDPVSLKDSPIEKLLIGADGEVVAELELYDTMQPTTYTISINKARQLMFWLQCGNWNSGQYIFYDLKLSKGEKVSVTVPDVTQFEKSAAVTAPVEPYTLPVLYGDKGEIKWSKPKRCGVDAVDNYFSECAKAIDNIFEFYESSAQDYRTTACYVSSADGGIYRAISIVNTVGEKYSINGLIERNKAIIKVINNFQIIFANLGLSQVNAGLGLPQLGFRTIEYGKYMKQAAKTISVCKNRLENTKKEKEAEIALLEQLVSAELTIDGVPSDDCSVFIQ